MDLSYNENQNVCPSKKDTTTHKETDDVGYDQIRKLQKRKHNSDPDRKGKPINVSNFGKGKL